MHRTRTFETARSPSVATFNWSLLVNALFVFGNLAAAAANIVVFFGQCEIAAAVKQERSEDFERTQKLDAMRKRQVVNEATLLLHQEEALRNADRLRKKLAE